ncbi:hypothetical protein WNY37_16545 [Henriciella sp. AS95]|uniref:hypothetical protein n=1 Tax=Henriciella sp. AS95 TaxID=3135782 RepID=UPI00316D51B3
MGYSVGDLIRSLQDIEEAMPGAASKHPRLGVRKTVAFLNAHKNSSVDQLVRKLREEAATKPVRKKKPAVVRQQTVAKHVHSLKSAGSSHSLFVDSLEQLKSDGNVRLTELKQIVAEYVGKTTTVGSKAKAYGLIEQKFDGFWKQQHRSQ